jgi:hypothetical protein
MTRPSAVALLALLATGPHADAATEESSDAPRARAVVEFRSYNLRPGTRAEFDRLAVEDALPLLRKWNVDVVGLGPSPHDETSYVLIRAFPSLESRQLTEDAFYASAEWREGPRDAVLALIESYTTFVLELDAATIDSLRQAVRR